MTGGSPPILDVVPGFLKFWKEVSDLPVRQQVDRWEQEQRTWMPELFAKQVRSYEAMGVDWHRVAVGKVFPGIARNLPRIRRSHDALLRAIPRAWKKCRAGLGWDREVVFLLHVGIGVGMGWATFYEGRQACLFGLENAAELPPGIDRAWEGTIVHEVAHLAHADRRREAKLPELGEGPRGPYVQLYEEGYATEYERRLTPRDFLRRTGRSDWSSFCREHRRWLAAKFLRDVRAHRTVRPFFGSWHPIRGQIECGYYLGAEMVREWADELELRKIAVLPIPEVRRRARASLKKFATTPSAKPVRTS
jgi:hypothetical protein